MTSQKDFKPDLPVYAIFLIFSSIACPASAELSLEQTLNETIQHHPALQVDQYAELSQQQNEKIAQSAYYPNVSAMALATTGFPGSAGATGIQGLMVSPYHKGPSAGLFLEQNIWDFGRTSDSVRLSEKETNLTQKNSLVTGLKVGQLAQDVYFVCSRDRSLAEAYRRITKESEVIEKEVDNFVRVGQRSIVDRYLAKSQTEEIRTIADDYQKRFEIDNRRLAYLTGHQGEGNLALQGGVGPLRTERRGANPVSTIQHPGLQSGVDKAQNDADILCPMMDEKIILNLKEYSQEATPMISGPQSPLLSQAAAQTEVSLTQKSLAQKDFNPKLVGIASLGWMNDTELGVPMQNYSAAVAVIFPLFEGFKTASQVRKYELMTIQNEKNNDAVRFGIDEANLNFDRAIESAKLRIAHLKQELDIAETGFATAKKRYFAMEGNLVDLREAVRNLARTSSEIKTSLYDLATQSTSKALLNGQWNQTLQRGSNESNH